MIDTRLPDDNTQEIGTTFRLPGHFGVCYQMVRNLPWVPSLLTGELLAV